MGLTIGVLCAILYYSMTHRTQLYLDEARYQFLAQRARKNGASIAQEVRDLIDERMKSLAKTRKEKDPLWKVVGIGVGDGSPVAENHKDYLYGK